MTKAQIRHLTALLAPYTGPLPIGGDLTPTTRIDAVRAA